MTPRRVKQAPEAAALLVAKGQEAKRILGSDLLQGSVNELERKIIQGWKDAKTVQEREAQHARLMALHSVLVDLNAVMEAGELARKLAEEQ